MHDFLVFGFLFIFGLIIVLLLDHYPYYTCFHIVVSITLLLGILLKRLFSDKEYHYTLGTIFSGAIYGAISGVIIIFCCFVLDMGFIQYMSMGRELIVSYDTAYTWVFITSIIVGILLNAKQK